MLAQWFPVGVILIIYAIVVLAFGFGILAIDWRDEMEREPGQNTKRSGKWVFWTTVAKVFCFVTGIFAMAGSFIWLIVILSNK